MDLLRTLLEPSRLAVVGAVALRWASADDLATSTGVRRRDVVRTLAPLVQAGLVTREGERYRLDEAAWRSVSQQLPQAAPPHPRIAFGMTSDEADVLGRFFTGQRLTEIPASWSKRLVVLERLALEFEPGRRYTEAEVNALLAPFHDDYASLRRHLVDEGLLDRDRGVFWRSGGRVV
ncbi:DUF2087 domain-containing protein [Egicoccus halophilus]|uniref:DUF2087 domain-containing protein n=1 Tax=Egicoccus halophilus TaxID=1670830 RepID=UPI00103224F9|nr:DUF2087 domain-containing protein [Egicoccus halophilus]